MQYRVEIRGTSGLIQRNGASGLDTQSPANKEKTAITKKRGSNRTEADDMRLRELETQTSLWLDVQGAPTIPAGAVRAVLEESARKLKQGPAVREGLVVSEIEQFIYDESLGQTAEELGKSVQFTTHVVVNRSGLLRTRALFEKWGLRFVLDCDDELVDKEMLENWLDIGGRRIGLGDWRPSKSGQYGRFETVSVEAIE